MRVAAPLHVMPLVPSPSPSKASPTTGVWPRRKERTAGASQTPRKDSGAPATTGWTPVIKETILMTTTPITLTMTLMTHQKLLILITGPTGTHHRDHRDGGSTSNTNFFLT